MKVSRLIELLSNVPGDRDVKFATPDPENPTDQAWDDLWVPEDEALHPGTTGVIVVCGPR